nr:YezD family protein [Peribacillus deserti]
MKPSEWEELAAHIERMLAEVKYGSITLVIQDGKVIQIEKNEKVRLQPNKTS